MRKILPLLHFCFLLMMVGCSKNEVPLEDFTEIPEEESVEQSIDFLNLEVGQKSKYLLYRGGLEGPWGSYLLFEYLPDTLVLEVVGENNGLFQVEEKITKGSAVFNEGFSKKYIKYPDSVYSYAISVSGNQFVVTSTNAQAFNCSRLFKFCSLQLNLTYTGLNENQIIGWLPTTWLAGGTRYASLPEYEQFGILYKNLNIYLKNEKVSVDGYGYSYIYSAEHGLVMTAFGYNIHNGTDSSHGWALLPD